jgi:hypothetical protein
MKRLLLATLLATGIMAANGGIQAQAAQHCLSISYACRAELQRGGCLDIVRAYVNRSGQWWEGPCAGRAFQRGVCRPVWACREWLH